MSGFILFGLNGWRYVQQSELSQIDPGILGIEGGDLFLTTAARADFHSRGITTGRPGWENRLNDLVTEFVLNKQSSASIASDLFGWLGQDEGRAIASMNHGLLAQQRVREAAFAFNLLVTGSTWQPIIKGGFPYRTRDWVEWCDKYIATMQGAARDIRPIDFVAARTYELGTEDLARVRAAFASGAAKPEASSSRGGCYVATAVYGSYDHPAVWVLRRWRDQVLQHSQSGRWFVRMYYAVSPILVRRFGTRRWLVQLTRMQLDRLVARLSRRGLSSLPYTDAH